MFVHRNRIIFLRMQCDTRKKWQLFFPQHRFQPLGVTPSSLSQVHDGGIAVEREGTGAGDLQVHQLPEMPRVAVK
jgi:hypothetical protein